MVFTGLALRLCGTSRRIGHTDFVEIHTATLSIHTAAASRVG